MKPFAVLAVTFSALIACKKTEAPAATGSGSSAPAPVKDERDEMLAKMTEFTDRVCGCKDNDCAAKVNDELTKWTVDFANKTSQSKSVPTPEQLKKVEELQGKFVTCIRNIPGAGPGSDATTTEDSPACQRFAKAATGELNCLALDDKQQEEMRTIVHKVLEARTDAACDEGYDRVRAHAKAAGCPAPE